MCVCGRRGGGCMYSRSLHRNRSFCFTIRSITYAIFVAYSSKRSQNKTVQILHSSRVHGTYPPEHWEKRPHTGDGKPRKLRSRSLGFLGCPALFYPESTKWFKEDPPPPPPNSVAIFKSTTNRTMGETWVWPMINLSFFVQFYFKNFELKQQ